MFSIVWPLWVIPQYFRFRFVLSLLVAIGLMRLVLGIATGILLWMANPLGMIFLRVYFALASVLSVISLFRLFQFVGRYHNSAILFSSSVLMVTGSSLVFLAAGVLYFSISERVRATYGSKLFG